MKVFEVLELVDSILFYISTLKKWAIINTNLGEWEKALITTFLEKSRDLNN